MIILEVALLIREVYCKDLFKKSMNNYFLDYFSSTDLKLINRSIRMM